MLFVAVVASAFLNSTGANAQDVLGRVQSRLIAGVKQLEAACRADIQKFCGTVTPGDGRLFFCVMAHEDQVSPPCDFALFNAARNMEAALNRVEEVADACWPDIEKNCAGGERIMQCLAGKAAALSQGCRTAVSQP
jgi:Golgi apparatus protein 1